MASSSCRWWCTSSAGATGTAIPCTTGLRGTCPGPAMGCWPCSRQCGPGWTPPVGCTTWRGPGERSARAAGACSAGWRGCCRTLCAGSRPFARSWSTISCRDRWRRSTRRGCPRRAGWRGGRVGPQTQSGNSDAGSSYRSHRRYLRSHGPPSWSRHDRGSRPKDIAVDPSAPPGACGRPLPCRSFGAAPPIVHKARRRVRGGADPRCTSPPRRT